MRIHWSPIDYRRQLLFMFCIWLHFDFSDCLLLAKSLIIKCSETLIKWVRVYFSFTEACSLEWVIYQSYWQLFRNFWWYCNFDFNVNFKDDTLTKWFNGLISKFPPYQLVSECTRVSAKTSSLLDNIYVSESQMYYRTQVLIDSLSGQVKLKNYICVRGRLV